MSIGRGISQVLARERAAAIHSIRYELELSIPSDAEGSIQGTVSIGFDLRHLQPVALDFAYPHQRLASITANAQPIEPSIIDDHIIVATNDLRQGANEIRIAFTAGDEALNRREDCLFSLFVPARAHLTFPCFDQPDLKARFTLALDVPESWTAVANAAETRRDVREGRARIAFAETAPLPTYLCAFAAGRWRVHVDERVGFPIRVLHQAAATPELGGHLDQIVDLHRSALSWLEDYTAIAYPFGKLDVVLVPSFQFSGMEHPGAIFYNASSLVLESSAPLARHVARAGLIAHETAHMWFGNLVTMRWFDEVWMKEVFASLMAGKILDASFRDMDHELQFLLEHVPAAYAVDRTEGANPIRQELENLDDAGSLYGPIIYHKAPIVMARLEEALGSVRFQQGVREYLRQHAFGNAGWDELVQVLDAQTDIDVRAWSRAWIDTRGRPRLEVARSTGSDGVHAMSVVQSDPLKRGHRWPQRVTVRLGLGPAAEEVGVTLDGVSGSIPNGDASRADGVVIVNGRGRAYGEVVLDAAACAALLAQIDEEPVPLTRGAAWVTLWDNLLNGSVDADGLSETLIRSLGVEPNLLLIDYLVGLLSRLVWKFSSLQDRARRAPRIERVLRERLRAARSVEEQAAWFAALRDVSLSPEGLAWLYRVWWRAERIPGLSMSEGDDIALATELAIRLPDEAPDLLTHQLARIEDVDRRERFLFLMPALSPDAAERERAFARLLTPEGRRRESWALEAQRVLNHPLREAHALQFVAPSLRLVPELRRTGDIFFAARWLEATLRGHRSQPAADVVRAFLAETPDLPQRLHWLVQAAADELFRAITSSLARASS